MSRVVFDAAEAGDAKAALEFLRHRHSWVATQRMEVEGSMQISITAALEQAEKRMAQVLDSAVEDAVMVESRPAPIPLARPDPLARETLGAEV
jgi:hypothetical protein